MADDDDLRAEAEARSLLHKDHPTYRPLSPEHDLVGLIVEKVWDERTGVPRDRTRKPGGDGGIDFRHEFRLPDGRIVPIIVDVKGGQKKPHWLLIERGHVRQGVIYVLAHVDVATESVLKFYGWKHAAEVLKYEPERKPGNVVNHCVPIADLRPMAELEERMVKRTPPRPFEGRPARAAYLAAPGDETCRAALDEARRLGKL